MTTQPLWERTIDAINERLDDLNHDLAKPSGGGEAQKVQFDPEYDELLADLVEGKAHAHIADGVSVAEVPPRCAACGGVFDECEPLKVLAKKHSVA